MASPTTGTNPEHAQTALSTLLQGPAASPPAGVVSNFHDPANFDSYIILTWTLCISFSTVAVALRMYTKVFILRVLAWEDYVIVLAWLLQIGDVIPSSIVKRYGVGRHMWDIQLQTFFRMLYWVDVSSIVYGFVVFFVKLSILLQYLRIFAPIRKGNMFIYVGVHLCIWGNLIFYIGETVSKLVLYTPHKNFRNYLMTTGHYTNENALYRASGIFNVISDFATLILPMPCVWRLRMPLKKKILLTMVFATGFFACIASILRTYYTFKVIQSPDVSYNTAPMGLWSAAEFSTGIIISCLPVIPRFFQHIGPKLSSALTTLIRSKTEGSSNNESTSPAKSKTSEKAQAEKLKLPSFKQTLTSVFASDAKQEDNHELYSQQSPPKRGYAPLDEESGSPRSDSAGELTQMPPVRLATTRDDLDRGYGRF